MKHCKKCNTTKRTTEFHNSIRSSDGLHYYCKDCAFLSKKAWKQANPDKHNKSNQLYYARNKERVTTKQKEWKAANKAVVSSLRASYRASKSKATPSWLTQYHKDIIVAQYAIAQRLEELTSEPWHVDHIVPLKGKTVCGLHVPWNLRAIKASDNLAKSNTHADW